jgi:hypothetical protein
MNPFSIIYTGIIVACAAVFITSAFYLSAVLWGLCREMRANERIDKRFGEMQTLLRGDDLKILRELRRQLRFEQAPRTDIRAVNKRIEICIRQQYSREQAQARQAPAVVTTLN